MTPSEWADYIKSKPLTPKQLKRANRLRVAFWVLFLIVFVILPIFRPIWS